MKIQTKVKKWGDSKGIIIPHHICITQSLQIEVGDIIEFDNVRNLKKIIRSYKCKKCRHQFDSDDEHPYCPACAHKNLWEVENEN